MSADAAYNVAAPGAAGGHTVQVQDADRVREFAGFLMHRVSTEVAHKPQWLEIELYKFTDGTCRYLLHFTGKSVLYHASGSSCNTGVPTPASRLPDDSEPCRKCRPGNFRTAPEDKVYEAETDRHKVEICDGRPRDEQGLLLTGDDDEPLPITDEAAAYQASASEMLRVLRESWHRKPEAAGTLSAPAQRLVDTVARLDEAILAATHVVERI